MIRSDRLLLACTLGLAIVGTPVRATAACDVTGTVVDAEDRPVVDLDVRLLEGATPRHTTTDARGRFQFAAVPGKTDVVAILGEGGPTPRMLIVENGKPVELRASVDPAGDCAVTLGPDGSHPMTPDLLALYQGLRRGLALMDRLGIHPTQPLRVEVNDADRLPRRGLLGGHPELQRR